MTKAALTSLQPIDCQERELALKHFYHRGKDRPVVLDSWFYFESSTPRSDSLARAHQLLEHPKFDAMAPNAVRALLGGFSSNINSFHALDGSGYEFVANQIIKFDQKNPITASRAAKIFSRWKTYLPRHSSAMHKALIRISESELSSNTREVIELILA